MDSISSFKGYGKVDEAEERAFRQKTRRRIIIIITSSIVLAILVIGTLIHKNNNSDSPPSSSTPSTSLSKSIKAVCSVTQYPTSCVTSLQTSNKSDPEELFKYSLQIAKNEIGKLSSLPGNLKAKINDPRVQAALSDCEALLDDATDDLNTSMASMQTAGNLLTASKIDDIKTWISSAITNQETCLDGLNDMNATDLVTHMRTAMENSTEYTSNSLAIVSNIMTVLEDLDIPIHRKLLSFPEWVRASDRKLLHMSLHQESC